MNTFKDSSQFITHLATNYETNLNNASFGRHFFAQHTWIISALSYFISHNIFTMVNFLYELCINLHYFKIFRFMKLIKISKKNDTDEAAVQMP